MSERSWLTYQQLVGILQQLCTEQRSGTLFCVTDANASATITLHHGHIVALAFKAMRGAVVLPLLRAISQWQYRFAEGLVSRQDNGMPSTDEILRQLTGGQSLTPTPTPSHRRIEWSKLRKIIEEEANHAFGPVGTLLCTEHLAHVDPPQDIPQVEQILSAIARATGETQRAAVFQQKILARLQ